MLDLQITGPDDVIWEHRVVEEEVVIGRSTRASLSIPDRSMSRLHARIYRTGGDWFIEDLGSRNGTFLDGTQVSDAQAIEAGQIISLGGSRILVKRGDRSTEEEWDLLSGHTVLRSADALLESTDASAISTPGELVAAPMLNAALERLQVLIDIHKALGRSVDLQELLGIILDRVFDHLKPEEAAIFLVDDEGCHRVASRSVSDSVDSLASTSLVREVVEKRQAALVLDTLHDERFNRAQSLILSGIRSILAAPLLDGDRALGLIVLASTQGAQVFDEAAMELLVSMASVAAMRISNVRLAEEAAERRVLEKEVILGRKIQMALLPSALPEIGGWEIHAGNLPSRGVSGDIYKVFKREADHTLVAYVVDVSGKGIAASLLTASLEALTAAPLEAGMPLGECCRQVSRLLLDRTPPERFATAFFAEIDVQSGRIRYVNAGHNSGLVLRVGGESQWLEGCGFPLGLMEDARYEVREVTLEPRDVFMLYTDGLTEAANPAGTEFGEARLKDSALANRLKPLKDMAGAIERDLDAFTAGESYADDRTVVFVRRMAAAAPGSEGDRE